MEKLRAEGIPTWCQSRGKEEGTAGWALWWEMLVQVWFSLLAACRSLLE